MALTVNTVTRNVVGNQRMNLVDVTFDNSYPTGGEVITPNQLGLTGIDAVIAFGNGSYNVVREGNALVAYDATNGLEVTNLTDLSSLTVRCLAIGR